MVFASETESFPRNNITDPLVTTIKVVDPDPTINLGLGILDTREDFAVQELLAQRLMPPLHGPNRPVNTLPLSARTYSGTP